jgi:hypothetical protein
LFIDGHWSKKQETISQKSFQRQEKLN